MNSLSVVVLCVAFAAANAGIARFGLGHIAEDAILQGPSSSAAVHGPDGSVIAADQPGGTVVASVKSGGVIAGGVVAGGVVAHGPIIDHAPAVIAARHGAVVAHHGYAGAPFIGAHHGAVIARHGLGYHGLPLLAPGSGLEGQYVHDYTETLYDNGQYHGEIYA